MHPAKLVSVVMLLSLTFGAGLEVNRAHLVATLRNYGLLARAIGVNFVLVPLLGYGLVRLFHLDPAIATGFLLMAIAPGVPFLMLGIRKKGGSLGLAVTMALLFPLISVITIPPTAALVLPAREQAVVPWSTFLTTLLLFQLIPLLAGSVVADRAPAFAAKIERPVRWLLILALVALLALLMPLLVRDVASIYGSGGIWAMFFIVVLSVLAGWLAGGPEPSTRRTLGIGSGLRNIGLCALLATTGFSGDEKVAAAVLTYFLVQFVVTAIIGVYFTRVSKAQSAKTEHSA